MKTYYFPDFSALSWCNNYGVSALFVISEARTFQSHLYNCPISEFAPVCYPYIFFTTHRRIHKRLTPWLIFSYMGSIKESELCIIDFPSWLNKYQNFFRPKIISKLKEMAERYNSLPNICYDK